MYIFFPIKYIYKYVRANKRYGKWKIKKGMLFVTLGRRVTIFNDFIVESLMESHLNVPMFTFNLYLILANKILNFLRHR